LERRFGAKVDAEQVSPGRFRLAVVSPQFAQWTPLHRQDEVWKVVDEVVSREQTLDITLILTYAPGELAPAA